MRNGWRLVAALLVVGPWGCATQDGAGPDGGMDGALDAPVSRPDGLGETIWLAIPFGTFLMGAPAGELCRNSDEEQHEVTLTHGFEIAEHEVTQGAFQAAMGYNPSQFVACGASCPVEQVNWHEAAAYCNVLSAWEKLPGCYACSGSGASVSCEDAAAYRGAGIYGCPGYRLPTEAEWEYAYRAGTTTAYYSGENTTCFGADPQADGIGWYDANAGGTTHPVTQKQANAWGLHDMAGNVYEWCHDWVDPGGLGSAAVTDPWGAASGSRGVARGGCWGLSVDYLRAAYRSLSSKTSAHAQIGFRCVRSR